MLGEPVAKEIQSRERPAMTRRSLSIRFQRREARRTAQRALVSYTVLIEPQATIEVVRLAPAQRKYLIRFGAVVMAPSFERKWAGKAEITLPLDNRAGQRVDRVADH